MLVLQIAASTPRSGHPEGVLRVGSGRINTPGRRLPDLISITYADVMHCRSRFSATATLAFMALAPIEARPENVVDPPRAFSLPFEVSADGYILMKGEVDNVPGVFLFDTGSYLGIAINRHRVPLGSGSFIEGGTVTSGQQVRVESHPGLRVVTLADRIRVPAIGDPTSDRPDVTLSMDGERQEKNIDSRLIGWIGWGFMKDYRFAINYRTRTIEFSSFRPAVDQHTQHVSEDIFKLAPASPVVPFFLTIAGKRIPAVFDTGGWDEMKLSTQTWAALTSQDAVILGPGVACATVTKALHGEHAYRLVDLRHVEAPTDHITLGYKFLRDYRSSWDPETGTVALDPVGGPPFSAAKDCS